MISAVLLWAAQVLPNVHYSRPVKRVAAGLAAAPDPRTEFNSAFDEHMGMLLQKCEDDVAGMTPHEYEAWIRAARMLFRWEGLKSLSKCVICCRLNSLHEFKCRALAC